MSTGRFNHAFAPAFFALGVCEPFGCMPAGRRLKWLRKNDAFYVGRMRWITKRIHLRTCVPGPTGWGSFPISISLRRHRNRRLLFEYSLRCVKDLPSALHGNAHCRKVAYSRGGHSPIPTTLHETSTSDYLLPVSLHTTVTAAIAVPFSLYSHWKCC